MSEKGYELAERGAWISIAAYIVLSLFKLLTGAFANSEALRADGLNNFTDIIASITVLIGLKISKKPRDENHPYGHSRAENVASLMASFIMLLIGMQVLYEAVHSIFAAKEQTPDLLAAWAALAAAIIMLIVYLYNQRLAKQLNSQALKAVAKDNLSDALVSIGAIVGIVGAQFGLPWLDPLAAFFVGLIIMKTAIDIFKEASHLLTDGFDEEKLLEYKQVIESVPGVKSVRDLKARMQGNHILLDVTVKVDPSLSVIKSHFIADQIEEMMEDLHKVRSTFVHIEPDVKEKSSQ
ncbi:cation diffusion facilitator family transporter [Priestia abyssalis]|uniref:cation diffusion facilitator family transporter n=1 Tax=Priestia abyssalis TaxID=1221450 RepID=UPI000994E5A9|nr:cation diffusion facilitator family transporter [Priestia abyssalis]